jgi:hypothetical protein
LSITETVAFLRLLICFVGNGIICCTSNYSPTIHTKVLIYKQCIFQSILSKTFATRSAAILRLLRSISKSFS